ncbi:MAG: hypothetical protein ISR96_09105 [Nitrospira sp.]|nr:hypothetical protein [bacterium]MBL7049658.1 hypothetical protein [Nitrospira sp.]
MNKSILMLLAFITLTFITLPGNGLYAEDSDTEKSSDQQVEEEIKPGQLVDDDFFDPDDDVDLDGWC